MSFCLRSWPDRVRRDRQDGRHAGFAGPQCECVEGEAEQACRVGDNFFFHCFFPRGWGVVSAVIWHKRVFSWFPDFSFLFRLCQKACCRLTQPSQRNRPATAAMTHQHGLCNCRQHYSPKCILLIAEDFGEAYNTGLIICLCNTSFYLSVSSNLYPTHLLNVFNISTEIFCDFCVCERRLFPPTILSENSLDLVEYFWGHIFPRNFPLSKVERADENLLEDIFFPSQPFRRQLMNSIPENWWFFLAKCRSPQILQDEWRPVHCPSFLYAWNKCTLRANQRSLKAEVKDKASQLKKDASREGEKLQSQYCAWCVSDVSCRRVCDVSSPHHLCFPIFLSIFFLKYMSSIDSFFCCSLFCFPTPVAAFFCLKGRVLGGGGQQHIGQWAFPQPE